MLMDSIVAVACALDGISSRCIHSVGLLWLIRGDITGVSYWNGPSGCVLEVRVIVCRLLLLGVDLSNHLDSVYNYVATCQL